MPLFTKVVQCYTLKSRNFVQAKEHTTDRTQLFEDFPDSLIKNAVYLLGEEEPKVALTLIGYPEDSVGRMMTPYYIQASPEWTVKQTLQNIKKHGKKAETLDFVYVVDAQQRLIDDIKIGKLLLAESDQTIESVMDYGFVFEQ